MTTPPSPKIQRLIDEAKIAFDLLEEGPMIRTAERLLDAFKGKWYRTPSSVDRYVINTIFSLVNLIMPNILFQPPKLRVRAKNPKFVRARIPGEYEVIDNTKAAATMEAVLNYELPAIGAWQQMQLAIQDALFWGHGVTKSGYAVDTVPHADERRITNESPFISRICPRDYAVHGLATEPNNAAIEVHRVVRHKDDVEKNPRYKSAQVQDATPSVPEFLRNKLKSHRSGIDASQSYLTLHEVHDHTADEIVTLGGDNMVPLATMKNPAPFRGSHFSVIRFARDPDEFGGIPLLAMIEDESRALNMLLTTMLQHVRKFPGVVDVSTGATDEDQLHRLKTQEQGSIHVWDDLNAVRRVPPMQMGSDYANLMMILFNIIDRILGIPDFQRGVSTKRKTATEVTFEQGDSSVRREYFLQMVKRFILENVEKVAAYIQQEYDETRTVPITGDPQGKFIEYSKEDIQGEYTYDFDIDSLRVVNEVTAQQLINALNVLAAHPVLQPMLKTLDPTKISKQLMKRLQLNLEDLQNTNFQTTLYFTPERENELFVAGMDVPDPKPDEDHAQHLALHGTLMHLPEVQRHLRMHQAMQQFSQPNVQLGSSPPSPAAPTPGQGSQPQGPEGVTAANLFSSVAGGRS